MKPTSSDVTQTSRADDGKWNLIATDRIRCFQVKLPVPFHAHDWQCYICW